MIIALACFFTIGASWSCRTVVTEKPNEPAVVARPAQPGPTYVWHGGEWYYTGGGYHWREGFWANHPHRVWTDGRWVHGSRGWYWRRGYWR